MKTTIGKIGILPCLTEWIFGVLGRLIVGAVFVFLLGPFVVIAVSSFSDNDSLRFPPSGFSLQWYTSFFEHLAGAPGTKPGLSDALLTSAGIAVVAAFLSVLVGVLAAYSLARNRWPGQNIIRELMTLPIIFPQIVVAIGLLLLFSSLRILPPWGRLVLGHATLCLPYVILIAGANFSVFNRSVEEAALGLGAGPVRTFFLVTLPIIRPGLFAAAALSFIVSFTNFTMSFFLSSGGLKTLPLWVFEVIEFRLDPMLAVVSVFLILITVIVATVINRLVGIGRVIAP
jgi:putative spermidine/putrescine transport system permease protein